MNRILLIEDNHEFCRVLSAHLVRRGYEVQSAHSGQAGLALAAAFRPHLIFLDLRLTDMSGLDVLSRIKGTLLDTRVVIMTAYPELSSAIAAIKGRVTDYLCKPFALEELDAVLRGVFQNRAVRRGGERGAAGEADSSVEMLGDSLATRELRGLVEHFAASDVRAALITGESGTGKELVARLLHSRGPRRNAPFVAVNCAAVSETLFESEFFGHERGAFTGAVASRCGLAELADGGTLFLDEIGEMPRACQPKLLRFLDEQTFLRVGGSRKIRVDVQILAATNRDLRAMVEQQAFRQDLYFRLNVAAVTIRPLRERREDILPLASYWLREANARYGKSVEGFSEEAERLLLAHPWPGNVRELRNLVERLVLLAPGDRIDAAQFPEEFRPVAAADEPEPEPAEPSPSLADMERAHIERILASVNGNKTRAAEILGISRQTLRAKLRNAG